MGFGIEQMGCRGVEKGIVVKVVRQWEDEEITAESIFESYETDPRDYSRSN